ncbi:Clavaminate synthase-like protein [Myriangium duriaei CBS 260.36]|uniref:Clavaminate synthase-like protein n=1 Tax=Myriangium duriaei CBS 260.36 TaxID=1168546 RepID=A0A9P4IXG6_9PEZI|nr:Clavaminate synthase-like protein [Myriangium duriaei CBS 260.36]
MWAPPRCSRLASTLRAMTVRRPYSSNVARIKAPSAITCQLPRTRPSNRSIQCSAHYSAQAVQQTDPISQDLERTTTPDLSPIWLRDICPCEHCVDPSSGQKKFWTVDIPSDIQIKSHQTLPDGTHEYTWTHDLPNMPADHTTRIHPSTLPSTLAGPSLSSLPQRPWTASTLSLYSTSYESYLTSPTTFREALSALHRDGLIFLTSVPESESSVTSIAERIGPVRNTFYGFSWDVRSVPKARNVAYTSGHLGFHQDLLYMADPPRLQFLHCLRSSAAGGASLFTDAYRAVVELHDQDLTAFEDLARLRTTYHYVKEGKHYTQSRRTIEFDEQAGTVLEGIRDVNWSPPFQGPFTGLETEDDVARWHAAARKFRDLTEREGSVFERMMKPGECVIFDNKRVLHARTAFEPGDVGKERWLKGCYVDGDPYWSALRQLTK